MPNRILKESTNESRGLAQVTPFAQDLFKRLITYADDYGRFNSDTQIMRPRLYPRELEAVTESDLEDALIELVGIKKIRLYTNDARGGGIFGYFPRWFEHQRLRNTRKKCPDPEREEINDWALQRFVPITLKMNVLERDGFICQECGRSFEMPGLTTRQALRVLSSLLHFDHVVPVNMGGRATEENLRVLCASCNRKRSKQPSLSELAQLAELGADLRQSAATGGNLPQPAATGGLNPIQSDSNPRQLESIRGELPPVAAPADGAPSSLSEFTARGVRAYESAIGILSGAQQSEEIADVLCILYERGIPGWWDGALRIAVDNNKRSWSYVRGILRNCLQEGKPPNPGEPITEPPKATKRKIMIRDPITGEIEEREPIP